MPTADDLKIIRGIGPSIESRLHAAGVFTFAQLAKLSPQELASMVPGLTEKRHRLADWISEAKQQASEMDEPAATVKTKAARRDARRPTRRRPIPNAAEKPEATHSTRVEGVVRLREIETVLAGRPGQSEIFPDGEPFTVRAVLDLTGVETRRDVSLNYILRVFANGLIKGHRGLVGEQRGTISMTEEVVTVEMEATGLPKDLYRLTAFVTLTPVTAGPSAPVLAASIDSRPVHVG